MACAFCASDAEYKAYAIYQVLTVYLAHAWVLVLLTMPAYGTLPAFMDYVLQRGHVAPADELRPVRTRAHMRIIALVALAALSVLDVVRILWAMDVSVQGLWQHVRTTSLHSGMPMLIWRGTCSYRSYLRSCGFTHACSCPRLRSCKHCRPCRRSPVPSRPSAQRPRAVAPMEERPTPMPTRRTRCHVPLYSIHAGSRSGPPSWCSALSR